MRKQSPASIKMASPTQLHKAEQGKSVMGTFQMKVTLVTKPLLSTCHFCTQLPGVQILFNTKL